MPDRYIQHGGLRRESRCEFERTLKGEYCPEDGEIRLDGLTLCSRHAYRLRLEGRVTYWRAMLAHVELWFGEARRRGRADVVRLLEIERARVLTGLGREEAAELEGGRHEEDRSGDGRAPPLWPPLLLWGLLMSIPLSIGVSG
jgi:hypothetical protein